MKAQPSGSYPHKYYQSQGIVEGQLSRKPKGKNGFGYDPIFIPNGYKITFGQMSFSKKTKIDHVEKMTQTEKKKIFESIKKIEDKILKIKLSIDKSS